MKIRVLALALALILLAAPALAEDRYSTIEVAGATEIIAETKYENAAVGLSFWYTPTSFSVLWDSLSDPQGQLMIHCNDETGVPIFITVELPEKSGLQGVAYLESKPVQDGLEAGALSAIQTAMTENGGILMYRTCNEDTSCHAYYVLQGNGRELQLYTNYALELADNYGVRINHLISTFALQ